MQPTTEIIDDPQKQEIELVHRLLKMTYVEAIGFLRDYALSQRQAGREEAAKLCESKSGLLEDANYLAELIRSLKD